MKTLQTIGTSLFLLAFGNLLFAQEENKVENFSFEVVEEKIKEPGVMGDEDEVPEWEPPRDCPRADIFSTDAKKDEVMVPENMYGYSDSQDGNNYAGLLLYSEREAEPRMYIMTKLSKTLIAGKNYCVRMHVSLADLSKYAINNIGIHLSSSKVKLDDIQEEGIKPQILQPGNPIIDEMGLWTPICMEFQADGTEKYLTIGNFAKQDEVLTQKMRRPREFSSPQIRGSYYYIDNISVIASSHLEEACSCIEEEEDPNDRLQVVYTKNVSENMEMDAAKQVELNKVFFDNGRYNLNTKQQESLTKLINTLQENPELRVEVRGHADGSETEMYSFDIAQKRAQAVYDYLVEQGIDEDRLTVVGFGSEKPSASGSDSQSKAQNRRVEFSTLD